MNIDGYYQPSFLQRYEREIKEIALMLAVLLFAAAYKLLGPVQSIVDKGVDPAVEGLAVLYSKASSALYRTTRVDLGLVNLPPDQEFLFSVQMASYINERRAGPLLDIAVDNRFPEEKRARALMALLKFETTADWIQPFLNELPKGGLLGLYDDQSPLLDDLIKKIRGEGGVRQPLVRAYAEVVFSFLLQVPDLVIRLHACRWLSDVVAEDAIFLLIPRFSNEKDPKAQLAIEQALYDIRAVSEPETARELLLPFYQRPPWPSLRLPLAAVLARLGHSGSLQYVRSALQSEAISKEDRMTLGLAEGGTPYPRELTISEKDERLLADRRRMREDQAHLAMARREQIVRQENMKQSVLAKARAVKNTAAAETVPPETPQISQQTVQPRPAVAENKTPPKPFPIPGGEPEKNPVNSETASLPPSTVLPPPLEEPSSRPRSLMNYVDVVFEVKKVDVPLFENPGAGPTGAALPVGSKGKADFEVLIGDDHWYQVKSKKGSGWVNGKNLTIFNLTPSGNAPAMAGPSAVPREGSLNDARKESTYFEAATEEAPVFEKPSEKAKKSGVLSSETAYLAIRSEKVGSDRWFLLQIRTGETAWARGIDLRLADVQQPVDLETSSQPLSQRGKPSAFAAEWVKASVKGVGVYDRSSITAKMIRQIDPPEIFKVLETVADNGKEWYRIEIPGNKEGWVQTMDVNLTKPE